MTKHNIKQIDSVEEYEIGLDKNKLSMITLLLEGVSKTQIAKKLNVSRQAVYNWLKDPNVQDKIKKEQREIEEAGKQRIMHGLTDYIDTLKDLAKNSTDARTQLSALIYLIDRAMGKIPTKIETKEEKKDDVSDDTLDKVLAEIKTELDKDDSTNSKADNASDMLA